MTEIRFVEVEPGAVRLQQRPPDHLRPGTARVRVLACGVCGTDVHMLQGMALPSGVTYPVRPGHEVCGVVADVADRPLGQGPIAIGDQVVLHPLATCGACRACTSGNDHRCAQARILGIHEAGGMADEVVWPIDRLVAVPGLAPLQAALLPDAVATAYHALRVAEVPAGGTLCVLGAGGIGTHVLQLARLLDPGMRLVAVVRSEGTGERVRALGVDVVVGLDGAAKTVRALAGEVDVALDFSGAPAAPAVGIRMLRRGGRLVLGSVVDEPVELATTTTSLVMRELAVVGAYNATLEDLRAVARLATDGRLDLSGSVSKVMPLDEAAEALAMVERRPPGLVRLVLEP
jgi:2-desacetyl-2-hydroxyethyl bacteriochlorophyllide A dehydrogenase